MARGPFIRHGRREDVSASIRPPDAGWYPDENADPMLVAMSFKRAGWNDSAMFWMLRAVVERIDRGPYLIDARKAALDLQSAKKRADVAERQRDALRAELFTLRESSSEA